MNDHGLARRPARRQLNARGRGWVHVNPIPLNPTPGSIWTASERRCSTSSCAGSRRSRHPDHPARHPRQGDRRGLRAARGHRRGRGRRRRHARGGLSPQGSSALWTVRFALGVIGFVHAVGTMSCPGGSCNGVARRPCRCSLRNHLEFLVLGEDPRPLPEDVSLAARRAPRLPDRVGRRHALSAAPERRHHRSGRLRGDVAYI